MAENMGARRACADLSPIGAGRSHACRQLGALALAALLAAPAPVLADADAGLKTIAVGGTLATWAFALLGSNGPGDCHDRAPRAVIGHATDAELRATTAGIGFGECALRRGNGWALAMTPVVSASHWRADRGSAGARSAWDVAAVPMLRWQRPAGAFVVDAEFGIGPAYLSNSEVGDRRKGTKFQFSDHAGLGLSGHGGAWRLGFAYRHLSNADIRTPNEAVDFKGVTLTVRLP